MTRIGKLAQAALASVARGARGLRCSFCGRSAADVDRLVAGASGYICDTCIAACVAVLDEHGGAPPAGPNR